MTRHEYQRLCRSCLNKASYKSLESARDTLRQMIERGISQRRGGDLHTYHCPNCGKWHLGNISKTSYLTRMFDLYHEISAGQDDWWPVHEAYRMMDLKKRRR